jgi:cell division septation protein DedD
MASSSEKKSGPRSFIAISRKALAGWVVAVFFISAWMFGMGVMVGRGTAPISYDIDRLKRALESVQKSVQQQLPQGRLATEVSEMKSKADLGFYDSLPKNREEPESPNLSKPVAATKPEAPAVKPEPAVAKPAEPAAAPKAEKPAVPASAPAPLPPPAAPAPGKPLTVQIAAVKTEEEARRLMEKLRQHGYAAYIEAIGLPDKGTWYRVRMGEFPSKEFARSTVGRLQKDGFNPDVVPK